MELLAKLFGSADRIKVMRYFLRHEDALISLRELSEKTKSKNPLIKGEVSLLLSIGFLEKKRTRTVATVGNGSKKSSKVQEVLGFGLNKKFPHNQALKDLLFDFASLDKRELAARFKVIGRIKLFIVSGVFLNYDKSRVDILIVGEAIKRNKAEKVFETLASEIGRDVVYSMMDVEEYEYRFKMYDKFVRDILTMPHEVVIDKIKEKLQ